MTIICVKLHIDILLNKKVSNQGLCFNRSVCMAAICCSDTIFKICSDIVALLWTIIHVDIMSNKKFFINGLYFYRLIYMAAI